MSDLDTVMRIIRDGKTYVEFFSPGLDDYELMEKQLTWVIRGDVEDQKYWKKIEEQAGSQVEHVFEVQYFTVAFVIAVRLHRDIVGKKWYPTSSDMQFAANLVNHTSNIKPLAKDAHVVKTAYFRRGANRSPTDLLVAYLDKAATENDGFRSLLNFYNATLTKMKEGQDPNAPLNLDFRQKLLQVLMQTPWYTGGWEDYLRNSGRIAFATNFTDAIAQQYYDDNVAEFDDNVFASNAWGKVNSKTK